MPTHTANSVSANSKITIQPWSQAELAHASDFEITCPPDKSVTHRSLIFAGMARGQSYIHKPLLGADCRSTMAALQALGVKVNAKRTADGEMLVEIDSPGWDGWQSPVVPLDFGNSGTTTRLLCGVFAATPGLFVTAFGDASLSRRPMARVVKPLRQMGASIDGRDDGQFLPLAIRGKQLVGREHSIDKASAQVKSALLLAGLHVESGGKTSVCLPAGSRDHTEKMLAAMGADVEVKLLDGSVNAAGAKHEHIQVAGGFRPQPRAYLIPGDPSSAAFFACLAALRPAGSGMIRGVLENATRTGFVTVLERLGVRLTKTPQAAAAGRLEPVFDMQVGGGTALVPIDMEAELVPSLIDEIPILAVTAMFASGASRFRGLAELRVKESDRLAQTIALIQAAGGTAHAEGDDLVVGGGLRAVRSFCFDPQGDHRLAMAAAIIAKFAEKSSLIMDPSCVEVSFPGFFDVLARVG